MMIVALFCIALWRDWCRNNIEDFPQLKEARDEAMQGWVYGDGVRDQVRYPTSLACSPDM